MAEVTIQLTFNSAQRSQWFAHLLTYLFHLASHPGERRVKADIAIIQEVMYRLFQTCLETDEESVFLLSQKEALMVHSTLLYLKDLYQQHMQAEASVLALEHLSACLSLLQEAEQRASSQSVTQDGAQPPCQDQPFDGSPAKEGASRPTSALPSHPGETSRA